MPTSGEGPARRPGCESCRAKHIKCDKGAPCGQCVKKGIDCIRATKLKFRHITGKDETGDSVRHRGEPQYEFSESQKWCRLSGKRLRFIDETAEINSIHNDGSDSEDDTLSEVDAILTSSTAPTTSQSVIKDARNAHVTPLEDNGLVPIPVIRSREEQSLLPIERGQPFPLTSLPAPEPQPALRSLPSNSLNLNHLAQNVSSNIRSQFPGPIGSISDIGSGSSAEDPSLPEPRRFFDSTSLPLRDRREAYLVRFFVDHIAPPFDFGDTLNRVSTLIPQYAALSPVLLNAVLALAAKSNDREGKLAFFDKPASRYHDIAVDLLEPVLSDSHSEVDEIQFAAAVLLRIYQIIDTVRATIQAPPAILDFLNSRVRVPEKGSLLEAAICAWIPAEMFRSVMRNEPLNLCFLDPINFDRSLEPADDHVWAFRMILHTIDILDYVFGETKDPTTYGQLASYAARWIRAAPDSFTPVFVQSPPENEFFPEILLINDSAVLGNMYYQLSRVLLTMHNPDAPRLSKRSPHAARVMKNEICTDVKVICGMAESISDCNPAHIGASIAIALAGAHFTIREEQEELYKLFSKTATHFHWDIGLIMNRLREAWGWSE